MSKAQYGLLITLFIATIIVVGGGLLWGFSSIHGNIEDYKKEFTVNDRLEDRNQGPLIFDDSNIDSLGNVTLHEEDIKNLNEHIKFLSAGIEKEYVKTQELIDSDIERIGIMMAITIGILTLLLGILPFLSNLITRQDMREEVHQLNQNVNKADTATKKMGQLAERAQESATLAATNAETANANAMNANIAALSAETKANDQTTRVEEISVRTEDMSKQIAERLPKVTVMSVHVAISRLINVTNHIQNGAGTARSDYLIASVRAISKAISNCREEKIVPSEEGFFSSALTDLYFALENWSFAVAIYGRSILELKQTWQEEILNLFNSDREGADAAYEKLLNVMEEIINELNKTQSAA